MQKLTNSQVHTTHIYLSCEKWSWPKPVSRTTFGNQKWSYGDFNQPNWSMQDHVWQPKLVVIICLHGHFTELQSNGFLIHLKKFYNLLLKGDGPIANKHLSKFNILNGNTFTHTCAILCFLFCFSQRNTSHSEQRPQWLSSRLVSCAVPCSETRCREKYCTSLPAFSVSSLPLNGSISFLNALGTIRLHLS